MTRQQHRERILEGVHGLNLSPHWHEAVQKFENDCRQARRKNLSMVDHKMFTDHIEGDSHAEWFPKIEAFAESKGFMVELHSNEAMGGSNGCCDPIFRIIELNERLSPNAQVDCLIHELAHACGITWPIPNPEGEVMAQSVANMVSRDIGLNSDKFSIPYITTWANRGNGMRALEESRFTAVIDSLADVISEGIHA